MRLEQCKTGSARTVPFRVFVAGTPCDITVYSLLEASAKAGEILQRTEQKPDGSNLNTKGSATSLVSFRYSSAIPRYSRAVGEFAVRSLSAYSAAKRAGAASHSMSEPIMCSEYSSHIRNRT